MAEAFLTLLVKLIPLYLLIPLGYIAGSHLKINRETLSVVLLYVITPGVVFDATLTAELNASNLLLPFLTYFLCSAMALFAYHFSGSLWKDSTRHIFAFTCGSSNCGYFGLPVALMLFGESIVSAYVMAIFGFILYESTVGFFITANGHNPAKESFRKVLRMPINYTFILGLLFNALGLNLGAEYAAVAEGFRGAFVVLGMMVIGIALSGMRFHKALDLKFIGTTFLVKFLVWPAVAFAIIAADGAAGRLFSPLAHQVLLLLSIAPLAVNTVAMAEVHRVQPEKAALAVLWSTIFALIYVPVFVALFF